MRRGTSWFALGTALLSGVLVALPAAPTVAQEPDPNGAVGQAGARRPTLPAPADGTVPIRFSVAGPVRDRATSLELITAERSCGAERHESHVSAVHLVETVDDVWIRLDAAAGPDGRPCPSRSVERVAVDLAEPLRIRGAADGRTIRDMARPDGELPIVNEVDGLDTGFPYSCGGSGAPIVDFLGPGRETDELGFVPMIERPRVIVDEGDYVELIGPLRRSRRTEMEGWSFHEGRWEQVGWGGCEPIVVLSPGLDGATWTLRERPSPSSRRIRVWVSERACASGQPPVGRLIRPIIQVRRGSILIIMGTVPLGTWGSRAFSDGYAFIDCQGAPAAPATVTLPIRLGDRVLLDGGVFPPEPRRWRR
jgi:hypothetical protein